MTTTDIRQANIRDNIVMFNLGAKLDNDNALDMVDAITEAQRQGCRFIIIDMTQLEFISSAGVGSILGSIEIQRESGGDIILCNIREHVLSVLEVLDLASYLTIKRDEADALACCE